MPNSRWIFKDVVHIHNGILFSHKIEQNLAICNNANGPRGYYANRKSQRKRTCISLLFQQSLHFIQSSNVLINHTLQLPVCIQLRANGHSPWDIMRSRGRRNSGKLVIWIHTPDSSSLPSSCPDDHMMLQVELPSWEGKRQQRHT